MKAKKIHSSGKLTFYSPDLSNKSDIPLFSSPASAGFPSPADDYIEMRLDINEHLVKNPDATYFVRVEGNSMKDAMINDGALLVVDRAIQPSSNAIAICSINGEFTVKRLLIENQELYLVPENKDYNPIHVSEFDQFAVWGVVTFVIQKPE